MVAGFALSLEQPERLIGYATDRALYSLPEDYWDTYPAKISAVSSAEVIRVAAKYLDPEKLQIVGVGEAKKVLPAFEKYGAVKLYDTQGKPEQPSQPVPRSSKPTEDSSRQMGEAPGGVGGPSAGDANGAQPNSPKRVQVGSKVQAAKLLSKAPPEYPIEARQAGVSGTVRLHMILATDGTVKQLQLISGPEMLVRAAMDALRQWRYKRTLLNGEPVEVETLVDVVYTLGHQ